MEKGRQQAKPELFWKQFLKMIIPLIKPGLRFAVFFVYLKRKLLLVLRFEKAAFKWVILGLHGLLTGIPAKLLTNAKKARSD